MMFLAVLVLVSGACAAPAMTGTDPQVIAQFKTAFQSIDSNHDNHISVSELVAVFHMIDANHDDRMSMHEYQMFTHAVKALVAEVYKFLDTNHDHAIDRSELNTIFNMYDMNRDGQITEMEWVTEYTKIYQSVMKDLHLLG